MLFIRVHEVLEPIASSKYIHAQPNFNGTQGMLYLSLAACRSRNVITQEQFRRMGCERKSGGGQQIRNFA